MNKLYYLPVQENADKTSFRRLLSFVSQVKRERIERIRCDTDKKLSLYSELLVRQIACEQLNISNYEVEFITGAYGKPSIKNAPSFCFNVSHTRNAIGVAISDSTIGVDIERIGKANIKIAKCFFTEFEYDYIGENTTRFYEIWTKKEAYIKYNGTGLSMPLTSFCVLNSFIAQQMSTFVINDYVVSVYNNRIYTTDDIVTISEDDVVSTYVPIHN